MQARIELGRDNFVTEQKRFHMQQLLQGIRGGTGVGGKNLAERVVLGLLKDFGGGQSKLGSILKGGTDEFPNSQAGKRTNNIADHVAQGHLGRVAVRKGDEAAPLAGGILTCRMGPRGRKWAASSGRVVWSVRPPMKMVVLEGSGVSGGLFWGWSVPGSLFKFEGLFSFELEGLFSFEFKRLFSFELKGPSFEFEGFSLEGPSCRRL
jgi:hypothetical protein